MKIKSLKIKGFRNLKSLDLRFEEEQNVFAFVGQNGQGKTNILESIYLCALSKSFRTKTNADLVDFEQDFCSISSELDDKQLDIVVTKTPSQKVLKVNGVKRGSADFIGNLKAVFFSPDDLAHMSFAPKLRRRYLDVLLSQLSHDYLNHLMRYEEAKRKRNVLLKYIKDGEAKEEELTYWDEQLAEHGFFVIQARKDLISGLQELVQTHYQAISNSEQVVEIEYQSECLDLADSSALLDKIKSGHDRDIASGKTQIGPHRDDLHFKLSGRDMSQFASRGEWRSLILALKFAEIELIKEKTGEAPVLLLDDVFSELDEDRQKYLFNITKTAQTFITTTHKEFLEDLGFEPKVLKVKAGEVI